MSTMYFSVAHFKPIQSCCTKNKNQTKNQTKTKQPPSTFTPLRSHFFSEQILKHQLPYSLLLPPVKMLQHLPSPK